MNQLLTPSLLSSVLLLILFVNDRKRYSFSENLKNIGSEMKPRDQIRTRPLPCVFVIAVERDNLGVFIEPFLFDSSISLM